ncbi:MAG: HupE/UreJ family protein [Saprospiraceae bacterium]|nr:HupE/UreJ family protein [Saprospiraceae bacterium]
MQVFNVYVQLGFDHISNLAGYDHILFLIVLCAIYRVQEWKNILILVTAFTIGHSVTLALSSFDVFTIPSKIIKFLIPLTIFLTALHNVIRANPEKRKAKMKQNYAMALFFGFIHGMDFSNYFKVLLMDPASIVVPLLGFNIGIEIGQLLVVGCIVGVAYLFLDIIGVKHKEWNIFISGAAAGLSIISMAENVFWT